MMRDSPAASADHNFYPDEFDSQGSTSTKRLLEDIVDVARAPKVPRLTETCEFLILNKPIELTPSVVSVVVQAKVNVRYHNNAPIFNPDAKSKYRGDHTSPKAIQIGV
jgi:hypothetical protein